MTTTRILISLCFLSLFILHFSSAQVRELNVPEPQTIPERWTSSWITHPGISGNEYASVLFRRRLDLAVQPEHFVVSLSADNKYTLYVNGQRVSHGPQLSDIRHWRFETIDIGTFLTAGENIVAVEVNNFGPDRFFGQQSYRTAFILNGISATPSAIDPSSLNTGPDKGWKTFWNSSLYEKKVEWRRPPKDIIGGFYANNPTDSLVCSQYPWDWKSVTYADAQWKPAVFCENAAAFGGGFGWLLEPRNTPLVQLIPERLAEVVHTEGMPSVREFLNGRQGLRVPARSKVALLIDHEVLTTGYPEMTFSGGKDAVIRIGYAENMFIPNTANKGNRNEWKGKQFLGITDVIVADGGSDRHFRPSWLRTFRFIRLEVETNEEPLVIQDFLNHRSTTSIPVTGAFSSSDPMHEKIFDICKRTMEVSTQDYFLSDAYYETMQYVGDTKVHALVWQAMTGNDLHFRNALEQFHYSRLWDGNLTSCYPLKSTFVHPTYSVIWIDMLYDYLLYTGDSTFIRKFIPGIRQTLSMFDELITREGMAGSTRWNYFVDWYQFSTRGGLAPGQDGSNSAVVTLHYVYSLQNAAKIFRYFGFDEDANILTDRAAYIRGKVKELCYSNEKQMFAERPDKSYFDQHTNIMAVLTGAIPENGQAELLGRILNDSTLGQATYYYRYYLFEAIREANAQHLFEQAEAPWRELINLGLSTTLERFESPTKPTRSECHPWSAGPAYAYHTLLAGIYPQEVGFRTVSLQPYLGDLQFIEGRYAHPEGIVEYRFDKTKNGINGTIELPAGLTGTCEVNGKIIALKPGKQFIGSK